jgi:acetyl-CoA carboxylase carboxyl transferase subunit beta
MAWFKKPRYTIVKTETRRTEIPEGMFTKCDACSEVLTKLQLDQTDKVCPRCGHHMMLSARERVAVLADADSFNEHAHAQETGDPLGFSDYPAKLAKARQATGLSEALIKGDALIHGRRVALGVTDFSFMGGSMGSVMGDEIARLIEFAIEHKLPLILVSSSGGGARMQEGILSLMQMAKTSAALARLSDRGLPYISLMTHPTGGGVTASWAILGDLNLAEPNALIMFAGARVIEQTIRQRLPKGFQRAEFLQEHGVIDQVVPRSELKKTLAQALDYLCAGKEARTVASPAA